MSLRHAVSIFTFTPVCLLLSELIKLQILWLQSIHQPHYCSSGFLVIHGGIQSLRKPNWSGLNFVWLRIHLPQSNSHFQFPFPFYFWLLIICCIYSMLECSSRHKLPGMFSERITNKCIKFLESTCFFVPH